MAPRKLSLLELTIEVQDVSGAGKVMGDKG
jgi:hypothetical protein